MHPEEAPSLRDIVTEPPGADLPFSHVFLGAGREVTVCLFLAMGSDALQPAV